MNDEKLPQWVRIFQMISGLILGFMTFVTAVVNFVRLWQGDTRLVTIVLFISTMMLVMIGCAYVAFKRVASPVADKKIWRYPRGRLWAIVAMIVILVISIIVLLRMSPLFQPTSPPPPSDITVTHTHTPTFTPSPTITPSPTFTPSPTITPSPTPTPTPLPCIYDAVVEEEERYPDPAGTALAPMQPFIVKWRIVNNGTCPWQDVYWRFSGDRELDVPPSYSLKDVNRGERVQFWELAYAPKTPGRYRGLWQMKGPAGSFGDQSSLEVEVMIPQLPPAPPDCVNNMWFRSDLTYPDGSIVTPGQRIYKAWWLRNSGTCHWSEGYRLVYVRGTVLEGGDTAYVPITLSGERAVVVVSLIAPTEPGHYRTYWQMEDPFGNRFGERIWIDFIVAP